MTTPRKFVGPADGLLFVKHILRKLFLEDWLLKLTALLITFGLWYGVSVSSKKGTATRPAQLVFRVSDDTVLMSANVQDVTIRVAGNDQTIDQLYGGDLRVTADLTQEPAGDRILQLTPDNVSTNLPSGVKLEEIQPSRIAVKIEPVLEKDLPVEAATIGQPAGGYEVYSTTVNPAKVRVRGPESYISTLESVPAGPVDITDARSDITVRQVPVSLSNSKSAVFNTVVDVNVEIGEKRIERTFTVTNDGKRVAVVLYGARTPLLKLRAADLKVDVIKNEAGEEIPKLNLNEPGIEIRSIKIIR
jgi:YbbR domain-containing protein